jgi:hypothetical protein
VTTIEETTSGIIYRSQGGLTYTLTSDGQPHALSPASGSVKLKSVRKDGFEWVFVDDNGKETRNSRVEVVDQNTLRLTSEIKNSAGQTNRTVSILERQ